MEEAKPPKVVQLTPTVTYKGRVIDEEEQKQLAMEKWEQLHSTGACARAARAIVNSSSQVAEMCKTTRTGPCFGYWRKVDTVARCAIAPGSANPGQRQAIRLDPMPTALVMAQERPQQPAQR